MSLKSSPFKDKNFQPQTLVDLLRWRADNEPDKIAYTYLKDGDKKEIALTYSELDKKAKAVAVMLQQKGLSGQRALLLYPPGLDYIAGFMGCLYAGVIAVPAYPPDPNRLNRSLPRLQTIVNDAGATVALTTDSILYMIRMLKLGSKLTSSLEKVPFMRKFQTSMKYFSSGKRAVAESRELGDLQWLSTDAVSNIGADNWRSPKIDGRTISFLQYTSGSTGNPKGVILSHDNLLANSEIIYSGLGYKKNTVGVFWLPIYHDMGLIGGVLQPLYSGAPSLLMSPIAFLQRPLRWLEAISRLPENQVAATAAPNFAYDLCAKKVTPEQLERLDLSRFDMALSGAEPVRYQTIERFSETFKPTGFKKSAFLPAYGLAEATLLVTGSAVEDDPVTLSINKQELKNNKIVEIAEQDPEANILVSSGHNHPLQRTAIVNPDSFELCKSGEIGEIWVKGPSVSLGYYGRKEATKETFDNYIKTDGDGPFLRTGDLGFMKQDELFVVGRVKDLLIIRGTNHYPQDIELTVEQCHPELRPGCSAALSVEENDSEELVIVAEVRHNKNQNYDEIIQSIREAVTGSHDLQARSIVLIKARTIQKTSSGKIMRQATRADYLENKLKVVQRWDGQSATSTPRVTEKVEPQAAEPAAAEASLRPKSENARRIENWMIAQLAEMLNVAPREIDIRQPFISFGMDSAQAVGLSGDLEDFLNRSLPPTLIWDYPTIESLARHLGEEEIDFATQAKQRVKRSTDYEPIAVIGMGAHVPGASNRKEFWQLLKNGIDGISEVPGDRWDVDAFFDPNPATPGKMITREGGFLDNVDMFDANFFGISPREAVHIDPQQRLLLEVSWEALEHAGQTLEKIAGSRTGVFVGISANDYSRVQKRDYRKINPWSGTGNAFSIAANRLSYFYDLRGPSLAMDTACSSSLMAIHNACQSLRDGDCDMAMAGGVNLILTPELTITFSQARMMASDGRCKTFDSSADGYGRGEGAGMVVLKRLSDAQRDGDQILAVVAGSAVNQDGRSNGITAPNGLSQQAVISEALDNAGLAPDQIQYLETHGTGTPLGDPIEIESIKKIMMQERAKTNPLWIGSVKTNIAHLEAAAGIAGFIKVVLSLQHEEIPKHLHFKELNPHIKIGEHPLRIAAENQPWKRNSKPRYGAVSAFGFGGTNAHIIIGEAPKVKDLPTPSDEHQTQLVLPFAANDSQALKELASSYLGFLRNLDSIEKGYLYRLGYNLATRRTHFDERLAIVASGVEELREQLNNFVNDKPGDGYINGRKNPTFNPKVAFVFSGQGPQWWGMGRELFEHNPVFRATVERISALLMEYSGWSLVEELQKDEKDSRLDQTAIAQPALFAIQVGLSAVWRTMGIVPEAVTGHSIGEVAAAHVSGILSLETAVRVVYHRSRLMQEATGLGKMAAVDLGLDELKSKLAGYEDRVALGACNSCTSNVISGAEEAIDEILGKLNNNDVFFKKLPVNYAFHSPQMEPFKQRFVEAIGDIELQKMNISIISTVSGKPAADDDYNAQYWGRNIREQVRFSDSIDYLIENGYTVFIEVGPHPVLKNYIKQNLEQAGVTAEILPSLRRNEAELHRLRLSLAALYTVGYPIDWKKIYPYAAAPLDLPHYPFQREHYWIEDDSEGEVEILPSSHHPLLGQEQPSALLPNNSNWTVQLNFDYVASLNNGREFHTPVLPESAYLEMAMAACRQSFNTTRMVLQNIVFKNALTIRKSETRQLHFSLSPVSSRKAYFQAYSKAAGAGSGSEWIMHSLGSIVSGNEHGADPVRVDIPAIQQGLVRSESIESFANDLQMNAAITQNLSKSCQEIWHGQNEVLARFDLDDTSKLNNDTYLIHPIIIDDLFQLIAITGSNGNLANNVYRPHSIGTFQLHATLKKKFWVHIKTERPAENKNVLISQIRVQDTGGNSIFEISDFRLRTIPISEITSSLFYEINWEKLSRKQKHATRRMPDRWLVFTDDSEQAHIFSQKIVQKNKTCITAYAGKQNKYVREGLFEFNLQDKLAFRVQLETILTEPTGIVYLWNLKPDTCNAQNLESAFNTINEVASEETDLWIFNEGAVTFKNPEHQDAQQSYMWDLAEQLSEIPGKIKLHRVDLNHPSPSIWDIIQQAEGEQSVLVDRKNILVPRMVHAAPLTDLAVPDLPYHVLPETRQHPEKGQVEIEVKTFMHKPVSAKSGPLQTAQNSCNELCGIVTTVGPEVRNVKIGDTVCAISMGKMARYIVADSQHVFKKPEKVSITQGAGIPLAYLATHYGLTYLARIQSGESILIHDAQSGFGQAVISIAKRFGSTIFATVNSQIQRKKLLEDGIENTYLNNSLDYIDAINEATAGRGIDIIVNTSPNDTASGSFSVLKDFGRFLELNTDGSFGQPMVYHHLRRNVSFFAVDMAYIVAEQSSLIKDLFNEVSEELSNGNYRALNFETLSYSQLLAEPAVYQNELKQDVVLSLEKETTRKATLPSLFNRQKSYLVAAVANAGNLALVDWMLEKGSEKIYFYDLSAAGKESTAFPDNEGVVLLSDMDDLPVQEVQGVLIATESAADGLSIAALRRDIQTIISLFDTRKLDFMITITGLGMGIKGLDTGEVLHISQFLNSCLSTRRAAGLPACLVQLGGKLPAQRRESVQRWNILSQIIPHNPDHIIVTEIDWLALASSHDRENIPALYTYLIPAKKDLANTNQPGAAISRSDLLAVSGEKRQALLQTYLANEIARVVKVPAERIKTDQALTALGIDSLMAIELKNTIESTLNVTLPIATLLQGPSINDLTDEFLPQFEAPQTSDEPQLVITKKSKELREFRLSQGQKAMYFQHMMNPESIFNLAYAVRIRSDFDTEILHKSFQALVNRHPSLRTTFHLIDGQPLQRIHPDLPAFFYEEDVQALSEEDFNHRLREEVQAHFDLENGPLMRVFLFKRAPQHKVLLFVMHHIVTDIWSQALLLNEMSQIFKAGGDDSALPVHNEDYTDFITWQDEMLNTAAGDRLLAYWKDKLAGDLPVLNMPTDKPRPAVQTYRGSTETIWLPEELSEALHRFAETHNTTVYTLLLAVYYVLLNRYTGQSDIVVGSPTAGRSKKEFAEIVGYFVNPVPFRADLAGNPTFSKFLEQVKATVLEAFKNMDYPLTQMVEKLQPQRDPSRTPLFQTMFILQRAHLMHDQGLSKFALSREGASLNLGGLTIESMNLEPGVAPFDLTMMAVESGSGLAASLGYNVDLFDASTISRLLEHYIILLQEITSNPDRNLSSLKLLPKNEFDMLVYQWNKTKVQVEPGQLVHTLIEQQARKHPTKPALNFENQSLSYEQLNKRANQLAHHLMDKNLPTESLIGICVERSLDMVVAMLAVLKAGCAYVPIDPTYPEERIRYMFNDAELKLILTQQHLMNKVVHTQAEAIILDEAKTDIYNGPDINPDLSIDEHNLAYIIYTSGSTGKPKGTMLHHKGLINALHSTRQRYYVDQEATILQFASFSFDASVEEIFSTLTAGATLQMVRKETLLSLADLIDLINKNGVTNMTLPPSVLSVLQPQEFPGVHTVISAGEKCPQETAKRWSVNRNFINGYGPTEATICTTTYQVEEVFDRFAVPIGKPIHNMRIYLLDVYGNPVPRGVPGEIYIGGPGIARGYFKRPELTAEKFVPDKFSNEPGARLYRTGDLARYLADGQLDFIGRLDHQVKIRGFRIELGEIENALNELPEIKEVAVIARKTGNEQRILAYVIAENGKTAEPGAITRYLKNNLPDYMVPSAVIPLENLPQTSNGKLDRSALPDPDNTQQNQTFVKPGSEIERKLASIWQEVLQLEQVGINDSFFDLGGHSLGIVQVQGKIKEVFDKDVNVVDMFKYPTISSLAKFLGDESTSHQAIKKSIDRASRQREATKMQQKRIRPRRKNR